MEIPCINKVILSYPILSYPNKGEGEGGGKFLKPPPPPPHGPPGVCEGSESFALFWTRDGKVFKLRIAAGDMTVSRLSRAFQAIHIVFTFRVLQNRPMT